MGGAGLTVLMSACPACHEVLCKVQKINAAVPPEQPDALVNTAVKSVHRGATTIMECGIAMALQMTGMQQKRHLANLAVEFNKHVADIGSSPPPAPSAVVFPALYSIMRTASTGATA